MSALLSASVVAKRPPLFLNQIDAGPFNYTQAIREKKHEKNVDFFAGSHRGELPPEKANLREFLREKTGRDNL